MPNILIWCLHGKICLTMIRCFFFLFAFMQIIFIPHYLNQILHMLSKSASLISTRSRINTTDKHAASLSSFSFSYSINIINICSCVSWKSFFFLLFHAIYISVHNACILQFDNDCCGIYKPRNFEYIPKIKRSFVNGLFPLEMQEKWLKYLWANLPKQRWEARWKALGIWQVQVALKKCEQCEEFFESWKNKASLFENESVRIEIKGMTGCLS